MLALWQTVETSRDLQLLAVERRSLVKHPAFKLETLGLGGFAAVLGLVGLVLLVPDVRNRVQDIYWFVAKVAVFMYLYIWYRSTFPRYRFDQLMQLGWKFMIPLGIVVLILTALLGVLL